MMATKGKAASGGRSPESGMQECTHAPKYIKKLGGSQMPGQKYVNVLLARNAFGVVRTFVVATDVRAYEGNAVLHDGELFIIAKTDWFDVGGDKYQILKESTTLYTPDKIMSVEWEKNNDDSVSGSP